MYLRNDWARAFVQRISRGVASRKSIAVVALARKLLVILWAMLRDNAPWRGGGGDTPLPRDEAVACVT